MLSRKNNTVKQFLPVLELVVFTTGTVVMILELVGSRILAPYLGSSIFIWTSLIGTVLASLSLGYWQGGRLADKNANFKTLSLILFAAAFYIGGVSLSNTFFLDYLQRSIPDPRAGSVLASIVLLSPPSTLLGMVLPYCVRLKIKSISTAGKTVGGLYALSTVGSILGTFATGFFLISFLGSNIILLLCSLLLFIASSLAFLPAAAGVVSLIFLFLANPLLPATGKDVLVDVDTPYNRVWIYEDEDKETGRPILELLTERGAVQSSMFLDEDNDLVEKYKKYFRLAGHFSQDLEKSLMIGGAAYSYPKDYLKTFPKATIDVVEIDSGLTALARRYFNLPENPRLRIFHEDGRKYLNGNREKYDAIFIDAFLHHFSIPWELTTQEALQRVYESLNPDGVVMVNIISSIEGRGSKFLQAEYHTYKNVFPQVYLFPVEDGKDKLKVQNIILVALKSRVAPKMQNSSPQLDEYLNNVFQGAVENSVPVLTDNHAPVDQYVMDLYY